MAHYIAFENDDGSRTLVEVDQAETAPPPGAPVQAGLGDVLGMGIRVAALSLQDALASAIRANAQAIHRGVQKIEPPPTEVEVSFALKATGELGNVAVGKTGAEANYAVKLVWKPAPKAP